jgi:polyferredoxin
MALSDTKGETGLSLAASLTLTAFVGIVIAFFQIITADNWGLRLSGIAVTLFIAAMFFLMTRTGRINPYRRVIFASYALSMGPTFMARMIETRGTLTTNDGIAFLNQGPMCHIIFAQGLLPYLFSGELIYPARLNNYFASVYSMLGIWIVASLCLGRGWCSWACFYGGWDDATSRLAKKERLLIKPESDRFRYFGFASLAAVALASLASLSPVYCQWICPFKTVSEFEEITGIASFVATIVFIVLFFGVVIVLPILTRKRAQCVTVCPFGAMQSIVGKVSPFRIKIDPDVCISCGACARACPTASISPRRLEKAELEKHKGVVGLTCTLCGECIAVCPRKAIRLDFGFSPARAESKRKRRALSAYIQELLKPQSLFTSMAVILGAIVAGSFLSETVMRLMNLVTRGSFLLK